MSVQKQVGCAGYSLYVEGKSLGLNRLTASEAWDLMCDYFSITEVKEPEVKPKKKRTVKPKVHKLLQR